MRKYALSLCVGLAALAWAEDAAPATSPAATAPAAPAAATAPASRAPDGVTAAPADGAPCCGAKVCVSVPGTKKKDVYVYDEKCVDYCLPHCSFSSIFWWKGCGCGACGCLNCGCPRVKHVLIKKVVHEECPEVKCEVKEVPACGGDTPCGPPPAPPGK